MPPDRVGRSPGFGRATQATIPALTGFALSAAIMAISPVRAQDMPTIDADGHLGTAAVGDGEFHAGFDLALHNGDFSRGAYDDDAADLDRLPFSAGLTLGWELSRGTDGKPDLWIEASSANGFHAPIASERTSPRAWYESNNLAALIYKPNKATTAALAYVIKTSPNGISPTSHELSAAFGYRTDNGIGRLHPSGAVSVHAKGGHGLYTLFGIASSFDLASGESPPTLAVPVRFGIGWDDFYGSNTGTALFGSAGLAYSHPFTIGPSHWTATAQVLALVRDDTVRRLGADDAEHSTVAPLATLGISLSY